VTTPAFAVLIKLRKQTEVRKIGAKRIVISFPAVEGLVCWAFIWLDFHEECGGKRETAEGEHMIALNEMSFKR
jgi:hypothetical protein